jgi:micrococcal nuclease
VLNRLVLLVALAACSATAPAADQPAAAPAGRTVLVASVTDGDTLRVDAGERVRLIGVDTPETRDPRGGVECFAQAAAAELARLVPVGSEVRLVPDVEARDRYGRTLAYAYRARDGLFVNAELVRSGFAQVLTVPPNVAHAEELLSLQREARAAGRGLWAAC